MWYNITAPLNDMRNLKLKAHPTNQMRFLQPSIKCSVAHPSIWLCCLNCAQQFDLITAHLAVVRSWEGSLNIWLTVVKNSFVSWALNFRVRILLKGAIKCGTFKNRGTMVSWLVHLTPDLESYPGLSPDWGHCVMFLGKTLHSYSASLCPGV